MKYIGVVECISSGRLYIGDIISRGYKPLIINTPLDQDWIYEYRRIIATEFKGKTESIDMGDDFDDFIRRLKEYDIVAVFAGSEFGVRNADRIVDALGLKGNSSATTYLRCTKAGMYEALGKAGIRRIETQLVSSEEDVKQFWNRYGLKKCVIKYSEAGGTVGLKICDSIDDAVAHFKELRATPTELGDADPDVLIQEFIDGTEYIVNTVSCDGKHLLTDVWEYAKVISDDGTIAYDCVKLIKDFRPGHTNMVHYAFKVLDAVDMKWGPCHTEIKIDRNGPVLIETNARPMGLGMTAQYYDEILGHHVTNIQMDLFFNPERYNELSRTIYNPRKYAMMKMLIVPETITGDLSPAFIIGKMIRSTREILYTGTEGVMTYNRTIDVNTSPLALKMANDDYGALMEDYEIIRLAESSYFHIFYTLGGDLPKVERRTDINQLIERLDPLRRFLLITDEGESVVQYGQKRPVGKWEIFEGAIYAVCGQMSKEDRYLSILQTMHNIRPGGIFIAIPESYGAFHEGSVLMDFLMKIAGIRPILPSQDSVGVIVGVKQ